MMGQEGSKLRSGEKVGPKYHIGIDFGTTYTGVAWMDSTKLKLECVRFIENWPSGGNRTASKVPTVLSYQENRIDEKHIEYQIEDVGFEVKPGAQHTAAFFKLDLDEKAKSTVYDDPTIRELGDRMKKLGKSAVVITTDYLSEIFSHIKAQFDADGLGYILQNHPLNFWITHPATWSDKAKRDTIASAKMAGSRNGFFRFGQDHEIRSISEPEAAAIAVITEMLEQGKISPGDAVVVCDAGGGTIDIVVYYIDAISPLRIRELVPGLGGKFGSTAINRALLGWLSKTFGDSFNNIDDAKTRPGSVLMNQFEEQKSIFGTESSRPGKKEPEYLVRLAMKDVAHGLPYDYAESNVIISKAVMESLFSRPVQMVINLLMEQITSGNEIMPEGTKINTIATVGGFGNSKYLSKRIRLAAIDGIKEVFRPFQPQMAIAKGAAFQAVSGVEVSERFSRRHYGVCLHWTFEEGVDPEEKKYDSGWRGENSLGGLCKDRLIWSVAKGEPITERKVIRNLSYIFTPDQNNLDFGLDLYVSNADDAPRYKESALGESATSQHVGRMWMNFGKINYEDESICTKQRQLTAEPPVCNKKKRRRILTPSKRKDGNNKKKGKGKTGAEPRKEDQLDDGRHEELNETWSYLMEFVIEVFLMKADGELHFQAKARTKTDGNGNVVGGTVVGGGQVQFI